MKQRVASWSRFVSVLMLCTLIFGRIPVPAAAASAVTVTSSAVAYPTKAEVGKTATIVANINADADINTLISIVVYDPNGGQAFSEFKDNQAVTAGSPKQVQFTWAVPAGAPIGTYSIHVGTFGAGWSGQYDWNWRAGTMQVVGAGQGTNETPPPADGGSSTPPPPPADPYTATAAVTPAPVLAGTQASIAATVKSAEAKNMLVDVEVYNAAGQKVYQVFYDNQALAAGVERTYQVVWAVPAGTPAGTYQAQVFLFGAGWSSLDYIGKQTSFSVEAAAEPIPTFAATATATPATADLGAPVSVTATVTASVAAQANVRVTLADPNGQTVAQQQYPARAFAAGVANAYAVDWTVPATAPLGTYHVGVQVTKADGSVIYYTTEAAGQFTVKDPNANTPPPALAFTGGATITPLEAVAGSPVSLKPRVTSNLDKTVLVDVEVTDPEGKTMFQRVFDNVDLTANVAKEFDLLWNLQPELKNGSYYVSLGIFSPSWSGEMYQWLSHVAQFTVSGGTGTGATPDNGQGGGSGSGGDNSGGGGDNGGGGDSGNNAPVTGSISFDGAALMAGTEIYLDLSITAATDRELLLNIEILDAEGNQAFQRVYDHHAFAAGVTRPYRIRALVPANKPAGTYTARLGLFAPEWKAWVATIPGSNSLTVTANPDPYAPIPAPPVPASLPAYPAALPGSLSIGVTAYPDNEGLTGWMPETGLDWDYAYQYLASGVNTSDGWATWGGNDKFAWNYARSADEHGYMPVFTYYNLLQSTGDCDSCSEDQKDLAHLNDTDLMKAYYENFTKLMKDLGPGAYNGRQGFGKPVIVHVEPDLTAYANQAVLDSRHCFGFCTGQGNNPAFLKAAVASSGAADVANLPDTYQGFNWALLHLRDLYAPNVILATHVSGWATLYDLGADKGAWVDAYDRGLTAGEFAAQFGTRDVPAGVSTYDLVFNDVGDRDAGDYANRGKDVWWDRLNLVYPNFHRWEEYLTGIMQATGKRLVIWQIPTGNQYFATMDNSYGHTQDNRVEYFFDHMQELANYGIVALMFGRGNLGSNAHWDENLDGVTNGVPFCTTAGLGHGSICNDHLSTSPDDDGGYLRMRADAYFQQRLQVR